MMKRFTITIKCRGCQAEQLVRFDAPPHFDPVILPHQCSECQSDLGIHVKRGMFRKQLLSKVNMIEHSKKLERILEGRRHDAQDIAKG